jgi:hypothetical protein
VSAPIAEAPPAPLYEPPADDEPYQFAFIKPQSQASDLVTEEELPKPATHKQPSKQDRDLAKGRLDAAIGLKLQGNNDKALVALADALRLNPDLASESVAINLAIGITGNSDHKEALDMVMKHAPTAKKRATHHGTGSPSGLGDTVLEIAILFAVMVAVSFFLVFALSRGFDTYIQSLPTRSRVRNPFGALAGVAFLIAALVEGGILTFMTVLTGFITYGVGVMLGGVGDVLRVVRAVVRVQAVSFVLLAIPYILFFFTLSSRPLIPPSLLSAIIPILGLGSLIAWIMVVANAHQVSFMRGCSITILSAVVEVLLFAFVVYLGYSSQFQATR